MVILGQQNEEQLSSAAELVLEKIHSLPACMSDTF